MVNEFDHILLKGINDKIMSTIEKCFYIIVNE